jgi:DinB superfamily
MADTWRTIVASALDWEQAHASFASAIDGMPAKLRGQRPRNYPHSAWELVEHIRLAQIDLLDFMTNPRYVAPKWPDDYWPQTPAPPTRVAWSRSLAEIRRDCRRLQRFTTGSKRDLTKQIPWGQGQTYLRTILVALDHTSYHVGQLVAVRRLLADWL